MTKKQTGLQLAIAHAGSPTKLAGMLGVMPRIVEEWIAEDANPHFPPSALRDVVEKVGGQVALANALGTNRQTVYLWLKQGYAPKWHAMTIATQFGIARERLVSPKVRGLMGLGGEI